MAEKIYDFNRRDFLKISSVAGAGLIVSLYLGGCTPDGEIDTEKIIEAATKGSLPPIDPNLNWAPNIWVQLFGDGSVEITVHRSEMGQGVRTALAMILAEDLGTAWENVRVIQAPGHPDYGNQTTGGSASLTSSYSIMRFTGAILRTHLENIAAAFWGVSFENLIAENGKVTRTDSDETLSFPELLELVDAVEFPSRKDVRYKAPADYTIIGTNTPRVDLEAMLTGEAVYGMDVQIPDMKYSVMVRPKVIGAWINDYDDSEALQIPGVQEIYQFDDQKIAVVADNTWAALKAKELIVVEWGLPGNLEQDLDDVFEDLAAGLPQPIHESDNITEIYYVPYLAHLPMEPMNCTANLTNDLCEVWAPSQNPQDARSTAARVSGFSNNKVIVHVPLMGGGFGRRLSSDYVEEAVRVSKDTGYPIKLFWTREDDIREDHFHPMKAIGVSGDPHNIKSPSMRNKNANTRLPTGAWRAVQHNDEAFVKESFIDELAHAAGRDPYAVRQGLLSGKALNVLNLTAEASGWGEQLPGGWGRGIAHWSTWGTTKVAVVAHVSVENGFVTVEKIYSAVDCGRVINPDIVRAQMESGIIFALSAILNPTISIKNGMIEQTNFHNLPIMRFKHAPEIETIIVESEENPSGLGEMSGPPAIAAVYNAVYDSTGIRLRRIPVQRDEILGA